MFKPSLHVIPSTVPEKKYGFFKAILLKLQIRLYYPLYQLHARTHSVGFGNEVNVDIFNGSKTFVLPVFKGRVLQKRKKFLTACESAM